MLFVARRCCGRPPWALRFPIEERKRSRGCLLTLRGRLVPYRAVWRTFPLSHARPCVERLPAWGRVKRLSARRDRGSPAGVRRSAAQAPPSWPRPNIGRSERNASIVPNGRVGLERCSRTFGRGHDGGACAADRRTPAGRSTIGVVRIDASRGPQAGRRSDARRAWLNGKVRQTARYGTKPAPQR